MTITTSSENAPLEENGLLAYYSFDQITSLQGEAKDLSGNRLHLNKPRLKGGVSVPQWAEENGIKGPGYKFYGNNSQSQCLYSDKIGELLSKSNGSVCLWIKPLGAGNKRQCILSLSNGFVLQKTEFLLEANYAEDRFKASFVKEGVLIMSVSTPPGSLDASVGSWTHLAIVQDGVRPKLFINGSEVNTVINGANASSAWFSCLSDSKSPPTKICVGATPGPYAPFMLLGLFAFLDEIKIWDSPLSKSDIQKQYSIKA